MSANATIVSAIFHDSVSVPEEGTQLAAARDRRRYLRITVSTDSIEVFFASTAGTAGTGTLVTTSTPLEPHVEYTGAIYARGVGGAVDCQIMEGVG